MEGSKWISQEKACEWLGVSRAFLNKHRGNLNIRYTYLIGQRVLMYNKEDIEKVLDQNSVENLIQQTYNKK